MRQATIILSFLVANVHGFIAMGPKRAVAESSSEAARTKLRAAGVSLDEQKTAPTMAEALSESAWATVRAAGDLSMFVLNNVTNSEVPDKTPPFKAASYLGMHYFVKVIRLWW